MSDPKPHYHQWDNGNAELIPAPSAVLGRTTYLWKRCCGVSMQRMRVITTKHCEVQGCIRIYRRIESVALCPKCKGLGYVI